jgi:RluA family pseudouridine synthase
MTDTASPIKNKSPLIVYDDDHCLVVFKQAGILVVPADNHPPSLEEILQVQLHRNVRAVHRIDKVTEGLVLFSKTDYGHQALLNAFKKRLIDKRYLLVTEGVLPFKKKTVEQALKKESTHFQQQKFFIQNIVEQGQNASTFFRLLSHSDKASLAEARPFTGRMHQIRAHVSHLGYPINGDLIYGAKHAYPKGHIALCACGLNFPPPKGKRIALIQPPSATFQKVCRKLGLELSHALEALKKDLSS